MSSVVVFLVTLFASAALGGIAHLLSRHVFYPIIIGSLAIGFVIAISGSAVVKAMKFRRSGLAAALGLAAGLCCILCWSYFSYLGFQRDCAARIAHLVETPQRDKDTTVDMNQTTKRVVAAVLKEQVGRDGFAGYLLFEAKTGVRIRGAKVTGAGFWILKSVELLLMSVIAAKGLAVSAAERFCEPCNRWYETRNVPRRPLSETETVAALIDSGELAEVAKLPKGKPEELVEYCSLELTCCTTCKRDGYLSMKAVGRNKKGDAATCTVVDDHLISGGNVATLLSST